MVIAKNDDAHHELARQFQDREVEKEYIALVWGVVQAGRRIDAAIGRDPDDRQKMSARAKHARHAVTRITRAKHLPGLTLCQVAIHTGRTHQIRVHLSAIGHPIVGDATYGGVHRRVPGDIRAVQRLERPFLHAARLVFTHPRDQRRLEFTAPLPSDLLDVLDDLDEVPVCVGYLLDGREVSDVPPLCEDLARVQPKLEVLRGWKTKTTAVTRFRDLPAPAREYVRFLEERCGAPSILISTGPRREETIWRDDLDLYRALPAPR
jgi:hypothetical protein